MIRSFLFLTTFFLLFHSIALGQITVTPASLNYFTVYTDETDSITMTVNNGTADALVIEDINAYHDAYSFSDTAFTIAPGGSQAVKVFCHPRQNIRYTDYIYVQAANEANPVAVFAYAFARHRNTYYDATQNKWNEDLKAALKSIIGTGTTDLGYTIARDKMFMEIDNQKVNGKGASQNTLACVYTDTVAVGYVDRGDCQTNYNFNTEHTWPQSLFGSSSPMLSDLHHLFPSTEFANTERGNSPFGVVTSPSWSNSGSKSNGSLFEPRDIHKGNAARSILYFAIRYQDYSNFCDSQEPTLVDWALTFTPTYWDSVRNADIFGFQGNRNPFVDYPEFLERISTVCEVDSGYNGPFAWVPMIDTLSWGHVASGGSGDGSLRISNQGLRDALQITGLTLTGDAEFSLLSPPTATILRDSLKSFSIRLTPSGASMEYNAIAHVTTNDPWNPTFDIPLHGDSYPVSAHPQTLNSFKVFPNPADQFVCVESSVGLKRIEVVSASGVKVKSLAIENGSGVQKWDISDLSPGFYLLNTYFDNELIINKLVISR